MDIRYEFIFSDEVFRFRYTPPWNCQWQQINYCLIYVFNESLFETVTELGKLFRWSAQLGQLVRWSAQIYFPHLKLSVRGDEVIADLCLQWESIRNSHEIRSSFQMKFPSRSTCQMKCTMRSDIPPINQACISGRPLHCLIFMTDWPFPSLIDHRYMADCYTNGPLVNQTCIPGRPLHCIVFMTDWPPPPINHRCMVDHYMT